MNRHTPTRTHTIFTQTKKYGNSYNYINSVAPAVLRYGFFVLIKSPEKRNIK